MIRLNIRSAICILSISMPLCLHGQEFGTLFTTTEERAYLDYLRQDFLERTAESGFDIDQNTVPDIPTDEEQPQEIYEYYLGGIITRLDGGRSIWLNGETFFEDELPGNAELIEVNGNSALRLVGSGGSFILMPGQTVDISTGEFWESFERRSTDDLDESPQPELQAEDGVSNSEAVEEAQDFFSTVSDVLPDAPEEVEALTDTPQTAR